MRLINCLFCVSVSRRKFFLSAEYNFNAELFYHGQKEKKTLAILFNDQLMAIHFINL